MDSVSGLRQRATQGPPVVDPDQADSSTSSSRSSTPASSEGSQQAKASTRSIWLDLIDRVISAILPSGISQEEQELNKKFGYDQFVDEKYEKYPQGFPRLAAFQKSDDDLIIFRVFHQSYIRILLQDEVEITKLEEALRELDDTDEANPAMHYRLRMTEHKQNWNSEKVDLIRQLRDKLDEYSSTLLKFSQIRALGKTSKRDHRTLFNWVWTKQPLDKGYNNFIYHNGDFVSVGKGSEQGNVMRRSTYIEDKIRAHVAKSTNSVLKTFLRPNEEVEKSSDPSVRYLAQTRLEILIRIVVVLLSVGSIVIPIFLLFLVPMPRFVMVLTVLAFVSAFSTTMTVVTEAKIQEVWIGSAA